MITLDVTELKNRNLDELVFHDDKMTCEELIERSKQLLSLKGEYIIKKNKGYLHDIEQIGCGTYKLVVVQPE